MSKPSKEALERARYAEAEEALVRLGERDAAYLAGEARGLERAAQAQCVLCGEEGLSEASRPEPDVFWFHPTTKDRGAEMCQAGAIRALKPEGRQR